MEFDTYRNVWDPQNTTPVTHVDIDIISIKSNVKKLRVVFTGSINNIIVKRDLHSSVDLSSYLPEWVVIGFLAGALFDINIVKSWQFNRSLEI